VVFEEALSAAAPLIGRAGDNVSADVPARPVDDREMRCVPFGSQYYARLGTDLYRFTSAIHMVIVIGGFDEGPASRAKYPAIGRARLPDRLQSIDVGSIQP
jgi:hypothetical protein